jgi:hypothetical protein
MNIFKQSLLTPSFLLVLSVLALLAQDASTSNQEEIKEIKKEETKKEEDLTEKELRDLAEKIFLKNYMGDQWKSKLCQHEGKASKIWGKLPHWNEMDENQRNTARKELENEFGILLDTKQRTNLLQKKTLVTFTDEAYGNVKDIAMIITLLQKG